LQRRNLEDEREGIRRRSDRKDAGLKEDVERMRITERGKG
jgi:hypothetical protein